MIEVVDMEDGTWKWECPCGASTRGNERSTLEYLAEQHELTHSQEWAPGTSESAPAENEEPVAE